MREEKRLRYYLYIYLLSLGGLFVYLLFIGLTDGGFDKTFVTSLLWVPVFVTLFVFLMDKTTALLKNKKGRTKKRDRDRYYEFITEVIGQKHDLLVEEYRKLKESPRFQKGLAQAYHVLENGETDEMSFDYILKKYPKQSLEYDVMGTVIEETQKLIQKRNEIDTK